MIPTNRRALPIALALVASATGLPTTAFAQSSQAPTTRPVTEDTVRLSDEDRRHILDTNTMESAAAARGELTGSDRPDRRIHGEIGMMIGTNGTRGIYGVAAIPLGDHGEAVVSYENSRYGYRR